jgi:nucleotide-binding universal stress UspA family protein
MLPHSARLPATPWSGTMRAITHGRHGVFVRAGTPRCRWATAGIEHFGGGGVWCSTPPGLMARPRLGSIWPVGATTWAVRPYSVGREGTTLGVEVNDMLATRILLAYDGTEQARRALDFAIELATLVKAEIGVVSVVPVHAGRIGVDPWDDSKVHSAELVEARDRIKEAGLTPSLYEPFGEIADEIVKTARHGGYDHVVIGSRHLNLVERILQGSVSQAVALLSPVTVTIVH